ncbi:cation:proton antiporter [Cryobacterium tepidiphilum]|uniref:Sodium:proton antiporter n=1 Tax=Cryobacterium tepidiphilum TaxID=2486026 RepID=A0A3M8L9W4_9MICO|nr:cation:proton antiporter [Cryobacterium tepidiphilum]RNE62226.1 sodium:proton antiporter [Cryobacterium tepidiphilum]
MPLLLSFALLLLLGSLISGLAHRTIISTAVLFLVAGFILGGGVLGVIALQPGEPIVTTLAQLALFAVLFTDGQELGVRDLRSAWRLPGRALLLGMPLTFIVATVLGVAVAGLALTDAMLVAAVLAPTDPVFASAIVGRLEVPQRLRRLLNVESGLNDGLALPVVLILIAAAGGPHVDYWSLAGELALGVLLGVAVPLVVAQLLKLPLLRPTHTYSALVPVAIGLIVLGIAQLTHANLYLAAFSSGVTIASVAPELRESFQQFGELVAELLKLIAILVFGALVSPTLLAGVPFNGYIFAALLIVVARPVAVLAALAGSDLRWSERLTASWFGPKGFASVLYGLLVLNSNVSHAEHLFHLIVVCIALSIVAHSSTDVPIANYFRRSGETLASPEPTSERE